MPNYFVFIDEAGNSNQERFFGLGLLMVDEEVGDFYDSMRPFYDRIWEQSKLIKNNRIKLLREQGEIGQIAQIAGSNIKFELKFKFVNFSNNLIYKELITNYFKFPHARFAALVIDRQQLPVEPWHTYIDRASQLLAHMIPQTHPCHVCVLADDLSKPKNVNATFEQSLKEAINKKLNGARLGHSVFAVTRLESHASLMLQVVDVLLGAVMYEFKKQAGLIATKLAERQDIVADNLKTILKAESLTQSRTYQSPQLLFNSKNWQIKKRVMDKRPTPAPLNRIILFFCISSIAEVGHLSIALCVKFLA